MGNGGQPAGYMTVKLPVTFFVQSGDLVFRHGVSIDESSKVFFLGWRGLVLLGTEYNLWMQNLVVMACYTCPSFCLTALFDHWPWVLTPSSVG